MGLIEAFTEVVLNPFRMDAAVNAEFNALQEQYQSFRVNGETKIFDGWIRENVLDQAQTPCNTKCLALLYCYTYLHQHLDANLQVIRQEYDNFFAPYIYSKMPNVLMMDVGCGPMTACLALADFYQPQNPTNRLNLNYIGVDREATMTDVAYKLTRHKEASDLFGKRFQGHYTDAKNPAWFNDLQTYVSEHSTLVFYFSYFFGQKGVHNDVDNWVENVKKASLICRANDTFIVYLNKDMNGYIGAYTTFKNRLNIFGTTLSVEKSVPQCTYTFRCPRGLEKWVNANTQLSWTSFTKPQLNYEILRVNWKDYENSGA